MMPLRGRGAGFVKITRDRTEQHQAGELLREKEQRFRLLATSIPQLVFLTRPDGDRTWPSPQWIAFTGLIFERDTVYFSENRQNRPNRQNTWTNKDIRLAVAVPKGMLRGGFACCARRECGAAEQRDEVRRLLNYLVGASEQRYRKGEIKHLGCFEIYH